MGVLKKLTDEYFEKTLRKEDGKYIEVRGFKAVVPHNFNEEMFLESVEDVFSKSNTAFLRQQSGMITDDDVVLPVGKDMRGRMYMVSDPIEEYRDKLYYDMSDEQIKSVFKFIQFMLDGVEMDKTGAQTVVVLVGEGKIHNKIEYPLYELGVDDYTVKDWYDYLVETFVERFKEKNGNTTKSDLTTITYYESTLNIYIADSDHTNDLMIHNLLYAKEMVKWWNDVFDEIEKYGVKEFFGLEDEDIGDMDEE